MVNYNIYKVFMIGDKSDHMGREDLGGWIFSIIIMGC